MRTRLADAHRPGTVPAAGQGRPPATFAHQQVEDEDVELRVGRGTRFIRQIRAPLHDDMADPDLAPLGADRQRCDVRLVLRRPLDRGGFDFEGTPEFGDLRPYRFFSLRSHGHWRQLLARHGRVEVFGTFKPTGGHGWQYQFAVLRAAG